MSLENGALADVLRYNRWANLRLIDACRELTEEQLDARAPGTSGSIRELLMHVVGGQQTSLLRTKGRQHEGELGRGSAWPGFDVLRSIAVCTNDELISIAQAMETDREVDLPWRGKVYRYSEELPAPRHRTRRRASDRDQGDDGGSRCRAP